MEDHLLWFVVYLSLYLYLYLRISTSTSISISISIPVSISISIPYTYVYLSKRFALSSRRYSSPKPPLNQARIYSTPTLYKEILNQHDDNIQGNYCASLYLNLPSTCFQGACRVVYAPWASHSTQHLACDGVSNVLWEEAPPPCFCFWPVPKGSIAWVLSTLYILCQGSRGRDRDLSSYWSQHWLASSLREKQVPCVTGKTL